MAFREKDGSDIFAQHDDFFLVKVVALADEAAFDGGSVGVNFAEVGLHAAEINACDVAGFGAHNVVVAPVGFEKNGDAPYGGAALLKGNGVFDGQGLALLLFERRRTTVATLIPFGDEGGVGADID